MTPDERIDRAVELLPRGELSEYTRQLWRTTIETAVEEEREDLANQTARGDAYRRTCNRVLEIGLRYRNALKFYGNPNNWRFTHDNEGKLLWVCSMGPDYALQVLDGDELNALKPHIGLRGIKELEEPEESESQCMVGGHPPDCKGHI
jgi:hypothetical protein